MTFNIFGVPVVRRKFDGSLEIVNAKGRPLCPWLIDGLEDLYVNVDDSENAFQYFVTVGPQVNDILEDGRLVIVNGVEGSGKTTLIHRCVNDLRNRLAAQTECEVTTSPAQADSPWSLKDAIGSIHVVDLSNDPRKVTHDDKMQLRPLNEINLNIFNRIIRGLRDLVKNPSSLGILSQMEKSGLSDRYQRLSEFLYDENHFALIILPGVELGSHRVHRDFMLSHLTFSARHIVFFAETTSPDLKRSMELQLSYRDQALVTHLPIGGLKRGDSAEFITARMSRRDIPPAHVRVTSEALTKAGGDIDNMTVRWLQDFFYDLSAIVVGSDREEISEGDYSTLFDQQRKCIPRRLQPRRGRNDGVS